MNFTITLDSNAALPLHRLHTHLSDEEIIQRAAQVGVGLMSAQPHYLKANRTGELILGYAELNPQQIQAGIKQLAQVL